MSPANKERADFLIAIVSSLTLVFLLAHDYVPVNWPSIPPPASWVLFCAVFLVLGGLALWRFELFGRNRRTTVNLIAGAMLGVGYLLAADSFGVLSCLFTSNRYCVGSDFGLRLNQFEFGIGDLLVFGGLIALTALALQQKQGDPLVIRVTTMVLLTAFGSLIGNLAADPIRELAGLPSWSYAHPDGAAVSFISVIVLSLFGAGLKIALWEPPVA